MYVDIVTIDRNNTRAFIGLSILITLNGVVFSIEIGRQMRAYKSRAKGNVYN